MTIAFWVGLVFLAFSIYMLKYAISAYSEAKLSLKWPYVDGKILESKVVKWKATSNHRTLFVKYEYVVSGKIYNGTRVSFYTLLDHEVLQLEKQYNASKNVPIYYNPQSPDKSTLIAGPAKEKSFSDLILASIGVAMGLALTIAGYLGKIG